METSLKDNPVHAKQHDFRSDRSTESAISEVCDYVEKHIYKKQFCVGVFLDIRSAFDSIQPLHIYKSLVRFGADEDMAKWYYRYLVHRNVIYSLDGCKVIKSIAVGFPQRGVASAKFGY